MTVSRITEKEIKTMLITKKMLLALTLVAALLGGTVGALVTHSSKAENEPTVAATPSTDTSTTNASYQTGTDKAATDKLGAAYAELKTPEEQTAYRMGFNDCSQGRSNTSAYAPASVAYREPYGRYYSSRYSSRRAYYDYSNQPRGRTFWQKHRDKLTMGIGTGAGALIGGLIGGGKGAGIGALTGLGGSALYTYKLRHRTRRY
jgi:hypothetical protein